MEITVRFTGGRKVQAEFENFKVVSDQPVSEGGENSAPGPLKLFFASVANCSAYYILDFCAHRNIPLDEITLVQKVTRNKETKRVEVIAQEIRVPKDFPEKYYQPLIRASQLCAVKKTLQDPPEMPVKVVPAE